MRTSFVFKRSFSFSWESNSNVVVIYPKVASRGAILPGPIYAVAISAPRLRH